MMAWHTVEVIDKSNNEIVMTINNSLRLNPRYVDIDKITSVISGILPELLPQVSERKEFIIIVKGYEKKRK
jgi:hypothetical protein